jgi:hypothetical protein
MSDRRWFRRPDDPGAEWAEEILAPLRRRQADIDVAPAVMRRIAGGALAPAPAALPGAWPQVAWAAALFGGFAALALLIATAGMMIVGGDEGARAAIALTGVAARITLRGFDHMAGILSVFAGALIAFVKGAWGVIDALSPLVRGGALAGAVAGLASIGISIIVVSRARRTAPSAYRPGPPINNGGLS